jgi:hypothetical protein
MATKNAAGQQQAADQDYEEQPQAAPAPQEYAPPPAQYAPPPADPLDEIEHLAQLHSAGALTDEEFAAAKAKALGI